ncbi:MAG: abortive infection family protein [bacterium]
MTNNTELVGIIETIKNRCVQMATGGEFSYDKYEEDRGKVVSYPELVILLPGWLVKSRYGTQYWQFISSKFKHYAERRIFLNTEFDNILDKIKSGSSRPITLSLESNLKKIDSEVINSDWRKVVQRSQTDPEGSVTASRKMVESVLKFVLDAEKIKYTNSEDLGALYKKTKKVLNLDPENHNVETFKQIFSGITAVVQGFGSLRNDYGDAHGKGEKSYIPEQRHAELVINLAGALSSFIIDTYNTKIKK